VHLVGFTIEIYHDARSYERQNAHEIVAFIKITKFRAVKSKEKSLSGGSHQFANHPEEETNSQT
jgi:hypothetical protein